MIKTFLLLFLIQCCYSHAQQEISNNFIFNKTVGLFAKSLNEKKLLSEKDTIYFEDSKYSKYYTSLKINTFVLVSSAKDTTINHLIFKIIGVNEKYDLLKSKKDSIYFLNCTVEIKDTNNVIVNYTVYKLSAKKKYFSRKIKYYKEEILYTYLFWFETKLNFTSFQNVEFKNHKEKIYYIE